MKKPCRKNLIVLIGTLRVYLNFLVPKLLSYSVTNYTKQLRVHTQPFFHTKFIET